MRKAVRLGLLFSILLLYFSVAPFGYGAFALLQCFPARDAAQRSRRARLLQRVQRFAFTLLHDLLRWARLIDFNAREVAGVLPDGPVVFVANHPSFLDVTAIMAALPDVTTAVKPVLYRRRWWRPLLDGARFFEGAADPLDTGHVVEDASHRIAEGFHVLIFPEGTRSPQRGLHRFGRTAFEVACRADVPVVPLLIEYEPVWLGKNQGILALPDQTPRMRITALSAVRPGDYGCSSRKLRDVIEALLLNRLGITGATTAVHGHGHGKRNDARRERHDTHDSSNGRPRVPSQEAHRGGVDPGGSQAGGHRDGRTAVR